MIREQQRQTASRILLAVFLSMMLIQGFHVHHDMEGAGACADCIHHVRHDSHFSTASFSIDNCVLCQFSGIPFLFAVAFALAVFVKTERRLMPSGIVGHLSLFSTLHSPRAPPVFILF
ncbi:MAG: hypothetical protein IJM81_00315 [Prevotella sp.]|nr:hypothetical protein [Prevotella sp.]